MARHNNTESSIIGHVKECHDPRRELCPHNADAMFNCDCKSTRAVNRKPFRVIEVKARDVDYNVRPHIIIEVHPDGVLTFREKGRRMKYSTTTAAVYRGCVWREAMTRLKASKAARKAKRISSQPARNNAGGRRG